MTPQLALASLRYAVCGDEFMQTEGLWAERLEDPRQPLAGAAICLAVDERLRASNAIGVLEPYLERFGHEGLAQAFGALELTSQAQLVAAFGAQERLEGDTDATGALRAVDTGQLRFELPVQLGFRDDLEGALRWIWCEQPPRVLYDAVLQLLGQQLSSAPGRERLESWLAHADLGKLLRQAIDHGDAARLPALLAAGADPNAVYERGGTPLEFAVYVIRSHDGPLDLVRHLLDAGALSDVGRNADQLISAVRHPELFDMLLDAGWDGAHLGPKGSALEAALGLLKKLRKPEPRCGADEQDIAAGRAALDRLLASGVVERSPADHLVRLVATAPQPELVDRLLAAGAREEALVGERGWNLLHMFAARGAVEATRQALSKGLNPSLRLPRTFAVNDWTALRAGTTPLDAVAACGREEAAAQTRALLVEAGAASGDPSWPAVCIGPTEGVDPEPFGRYGTLARRLAEFLPKQVTATPGVSGLAFYHAIREAVEEGAPFVLAEGERADDVEGLVRALSALGLPAEFVKGI